MSKKLYEHFSHKEYSQRHVFQRADNCSCCPVHSAVGWAVTLKCKNATPVMGQHQKHVKDLEMDGGHRLANARSLDDVKKDGYSTIFTTTFQAHLPNPEKPPLFIDLAAHKVGDQLIIDSKLTERLRSSFLLETIIPQYADNLKSLRGFKFDWGRSDLNQDHVHSNQAFTHKLNEFGIAHEAEEYNGTWGEGNWGKDGRVSTEVLPFFSRHLVFDKT